MGAKGAAAGALVGFNEVGPEAASFPTPTDVARGGITPPHSPITGTRGMAATGEVGVGIAIPADTSPTLAIPERDTGGTIESFGAPSMGDIGLTGMALASRTKTTMQKITLVTRNQRGMDWLFLVIFRSIHRPRVQLSPFGYSFVSNEVPVQLPC
jgi:hypothetical protein